MRARYLVLGPSSSFTHKARRPWLLSQPRPPSFTIPRRVRYYLRKESIDTDASCLIDRRRAAKRYRHGRERHIGVLTHDVITFIGLMAITLAVPMIVENRIGNRSRLPPNAMF